MSPTIEPVEPGVPGRRSSALHLFALLRLVVFFVVLLAGDVAAQLALGWAFRHAPAGAADGVALGSAIALAAALIGLYIALVRVMEHRRAGELVPGARRALGGALLGVALFVAVIGLIRAAGGAELHGLSARFDPVPMLSAALLAAVGEELAFRGGVFRILEESRGTTVALVLSAALFGLMHALNPGATVVSTIAIAVEAGVLLGAAYALTGNLWLPIGLHLGWNFTEGGIFGVSVSGGAPGKGLIGVTLAGPKWLTGGAFGPEASAVAVAVCFAAALVLIGVILRRGRWKPLA